MNYYNPYYYIPTGGTPSLFSALKNGINWSGILNGTQRTLNIINQAIPLVKQAAPMMKNAKTMFKVMNEFKKVDVPVKKKENKILGNEKQNNNEPVSNSPTFFL
ncbi:MAG: VrrA/YqfQ family protein [Bacilli bacterium]|nr:VrrA/YqfQ family protein [Bacilli bacterium]